MTMSCVQALLEDAENCAYLPFGEEAVLCVLNHPESLKQERVGYYLVIMKGGCAVLKDVVRGYETLVLYLEHAGLTALQGWMPASAYKGGKLAEHIQMASFSLYKLAR